MDARVFFWELLNMHVEGFRVSTEDVVCTEYFPFPHGSK